MDKEIAIEEVEWESIGEEKWLVGVCSHCSRRIFNLDWDGNNPLVCSYCLSKGVKN